MQGDVSQGRWAVSGSSTERRRGRVSVRGICAGVRLQLLPPLLKGSLYLRVKPSPSTRARQVWPASASAVTQPSVREAGVGNKRADKTTSRAADPCGASGEGEGDGPAGELAANNFARFLLLSRNLNGSPSESDHALASAGIVRDGDPVDQR